MLDAAQPEGLAERVTEILAAHAGVEGALLPILHAVQADYGFVPQAALPQIAAALGQTRAEVHGVMSFYHDFREEPAGRHVVKLCRSEACQAMGGAALVAEAEAALGCAMGETRADQKVTLEPIYCLGLCACGPAAQVDGKLVGRLDAAKLAKIKSEIGA
jgi:formate dehydrogenase subunit gamma